jgi:predicted aconitase with swiveling domain
MSKTVEIAARVIVRGMARGPALVAAEPISFLGDVDVGSGRIVGDLPSVHGLLVAGTILIFPFTRGSAGAWRFIYQLYKHGTHPLALVTERVPDPSVVQGAILAGIPVLCEPQAPLAERLRRGDMVEVNAEQGRIRFTTTG